jgi:hypothetical protein
VLGSGVDRSARRTHGGAGGGDIVHHDHEVATEIDAGLQGDGFLDVRGSFAQRERDLRGTVAAFQGVHDPAAGGLRYAAGDRSGVIDAPEEATAEGYGNGNDDDWRQVVVGAEAIQAFGDPGAEPLSQVNPEAPPARELHFVDEGGKGRAVLAEADHAGPGEAFAGAVGAAVGVAFKGADAVGAAVAVRVGFIRSEAEGGGAIGKRRGGQVEPGTLEGGPEGAMGSGRGCGWLGHRARLGRGDE